MSQTLTDDQLEAGHRLFERQWTFVRGVPSLDFLPPAEVAEIAFAGRSNVGKSSLINALVRQGGLARTSNTPGRTQELNFFQTDGVPMFLVDMPGYGFAKAPKAKVDAWTGLVNDYLRGRPTLARVYLLIDSRHGIKPVDATVLDMLDTAAVSYQIVLTKADKIPPHALEAVAAGARKALARRPAAYPELIATSSETGAGIDMLRGAISVLLAERGIA
ncbi:MAG: YihA family ribosome biogenesis GTP-binding protein [Hyphomicrobiaceae bacterium]|nr:YihA family ribosome biogenesis GTP-binding protein [Hyphomicrobiaceae bacterium]